MDSLQPFREHLGADAILTKPDDLAHFGRDWCKEFEAKPTGILLPSSTEQAQRIVSIANQHRIALVPSGGRTGLSGAATATAGEVVVAFDRMNKILELNHDDRTIRCEAGTITEKVQQVAVENGFFFPVDFPTAGSSQIGGNIATDVGGIHVVRFGKIKDWVLGMKVITGEGKLLDLNGPLYKNRSGYDLHSLFIGSEGTLGLIVEATLKLAVKPPPTTRFFCAIRSTDRILTIFQRVLKAMGMPTTFEYFSEAGMTAVTAHTTLRTPFKERYQHYLVIEVDRPTSEDQTSVTDLLEALFEQELIADAVVAENQRQFEDLMALRERIGEVLATHYLTHKNDISVPISSIPAFIAELEETTRLQYPDLPVVIFGHIGDGNLHINISKPENLSREAFLDLCKQADPLLFDLVRKHRGSISAEHGVGLLKRDYLHFSRTAEEIEYMRKIKAIFDPNGIMNPGKIFTL